MNANLYIYNCKKTKEMTHKSNGLQLKWHLNTTLKNWYTDVSDIQITNAIGNIFGKHFVTIYNNSKLHLFFLGDSISRI